MYMYQIIWNLKIFAKIVLFLLCFYSSSALNNRPLFMHNGSNNNNRRTSGLVDVEVSNFRRALPQFLAVSIKNILLFGK